MILKCALATLASAGVLTGLAATAAMPNLKLQPVFANAEIQRPLCLVEAPDGSGRMYIVEQQGRVLMVHKGTDGADAKEVFNIVDRRPYIENESGLLGFAFHPDFKSNHEVFIYYSQNNPPASAYLQFPKKTVLSRLTMSTTNADVIDLSSEQKLLEIPRPYWNHEGGCVMFGPDGYLYFSSGDGGLANDPHNSGQSLTTLLGKIARIDVDKKPGNLEPAVTGVGRRGGGQGQMGLVNVPPGPDRRAAYSVPADNPFVNADDIRIGVRPEIYAYGLRNAWRFTFDRETGELWAGDVGQDKWEEVDLIVKGGNYGWSVMEGFHHFKPAPEGVKYIDPIIEFAHNATLAKQSQFPDQPIGNCITGGYVYRGKKFPELRGVYIYADEGFGAVFGLRYENGKMTEHATLLRQPKNITSFAEDSDGELYALTLDGRIFQITPAAN